MLTGEYGEEGPYATSQWSAPDDLGGHRGLANVVATAIVTLMNNSTYTSAFQMARPGPAALCLQARLLLLP